MNKEDAVAWIRRSRVVPVVRAPSPELAIAAAEALIEGGIDILEITMTVPGAVAVLGELVGQFGSSVLVGAGTVRDSANAEACFEAGARFIVCPALDPAIVQTCRALDVAIAPGALTPTEIAYAWSLGGDIVKVFPCDAMGGPSYLKSLKAPLPEISLMPTGGVTIENLTEFFAAGADAVGVGSNLVDIKLLTDGRREEVVLRAKAFAAAARRA